MKKVYLLIFRKIAFSLGVFGAIITIAAMGSASALANSGSATPVRCYSSQLSVSLGSGNGAAGSSYYPLNFKNTSKVTCSLYGYPGVSALLNGKQLGAAAVRETSVPKSTVILKPGVTVNAVLQVTDVSVYSKLQCEPKTATQLKVYPPGASDAKVISVGLMGCSVPSTAYIHVEVVRS
jgi:hypothetical protein